MSGEADSVSGVGETGDRAHVAHVHVPLNSRRLTAGQLRRLAMALEVPSSGNPADTRLIIEGKLAEMGRQPRNVQVVLEGGSPTAGLSLRDETGIFVTVDPEVLSEAVHDREPTERDNEETRQSLSEEEDNEESVESLKVALEEANQQKEALQEEVQTLRQELAASKARITELWKLSCSQVQEYDQIIAAKDDEIAELRALDTGAVRDPPTTDTLNISTTTEGTTHSVGQAAKESRRGKAPPVDIFTGEDPDVRFDDWLPALDRVSAWNGWSRQETLLQLAGYLRGRALQEWNLLSKEEQSEYGVAVKALHQRLDQGSLMVAVQDFRHVCQNETEMITDYIRRLERCYHLAYGRDKLTAETKEAILFGQLQAGLSYQILKCPAVSGSQSYKGLCTAAKAEEKRIAELRRRQQYYRRSGPPRNARPVEQLPTQSPAPGSEQPSTPEGNTQSTNYPTPRKQCYICGDTKHLARKCTKRKQESTPSEDASRRNTHNNSSANMVRTVSDPMNFLYSSESDDGSVCVVRVEDKGSKPRTVVVNLHGVPARGIIDSGADITIINGDLFQRVATVAHLKKSAFKKPDRIPVTYDQKPFTLDGRMDLDITFDGKTMRTAVYIKMDSRDPLLLSEGVCHQLGIISYHPDVEDTTSQGNRQHKQPVVPSVRIKLIHAVRLPPRHDVKVSIHLEGKDELCGPVMIESDTDCLPDGILATESLIVAPETRQTEILLTNSTGITQQLDAGVCLGHASEVDIIPHALLTSGMDENSGNANNTGNEREADPASVLTITTPDVTSRKQKLAKLLAGEGAALKWQDKDKLLQFLLANHQAFAIDEADRGETDLIEMTIDTGDAQPKQVPPRRTPLAARQEIAMQLKKMQDQGVIQPSCSPWASPVVLVRKKDGTMRFCIDYRQLNQATKPDVFPLPRISDLLDQIGKAQFFSTLDLASGYWQVRMHSDSQQKTAFTTSYGLFEFRVMPFGLRNAPAVFQRLMQRILTGLNPSDGPDFVSVYLDDILVFSPSLDDHLKHLGQVLERLSQAGLKLKPSKCHFLTQQVEYLGHIITPQGIKPNPEREKAVRDFPVPTSLKDVRAFVGLASYYRRFIKGFAQIAHPLHCLTRKGALFNWTEQCQGAFDQLKQRLYLQQLLCFIQNGTLPDNNDSARKVAAQAPLFTLVDGVLFFINPKYRDRKQCVVPRHLQQTIMEEHHSSPMSGHFSGEKLYKVLSRHWWWQGMYGDVIAHCRSCPQCAIVNASGKINKPPLHPIPVERVFQIIGVDIMDLPLTANGNRHVVVFQDFLSKWPLVFPVPDQKAERLARLLVNEVVPFCGVPEALLSDRGTNLLSHLMTDVCKLLGTKKVNTTAYHPQCDGMVERFNRTLKTMLRKHADVFGNQWDQFLPGVLWAYRNTPHDSTGEKPSFLLFGIDCRSPSEAAYLKPADTYPVDINDYREELQVSITSARKLAVTTIQKAQKKQKASYDKHTNCTESSFKIGQWVLVYFPQENTGPNRKLSRPWHGPYRITANEQPDICVSKVYFPDDKVIRIHLSRVKVCPAHFPAGFYWYGSKRRSPGRAPKWVAEMMALCNQSTEEQAREEVKEVEPSEADLKGRSSGSTAADCQATSQTAEGKKTGDGTRQVKQPNTGGTHNQKVSANSQETPSTLTLQRQKPKKDHPPPAAPKKTRTRKVLPPARYS